MDYQFIDKKTTLCSLFGDEITEENESPSFQCLSNSSPLLHGTNSNNTNISPVLSQTPESSWCRSPSLTPSHPLLFYCCISSLHHDGTINSINISGNLVLTGSSSTRIHVWQSLDCHAKGYIQTSSGEIQAMVAHGDMLFTSHKDHKLRIWNLRTSSGDLKPRKVTTLPSSTHFNIYSICRPIVPQQHDINSCMAYYHVEGILYTGSFDTTVKAWKLSERKCVDTFTAHADKITDIVINQQSGYIFTSSFDGTVKLWSPYGEASHTLINVLIFQTNPIYALTISVSPSESSILYSGSSDGCINFWVQNTTLQYNHGGFIEGHQFAVLCLVALENLVITGSEDATIRIWRRAGGRFSHECLAVLEGHKGPVRCLVAFLPKNAVGMCFLVYSASLDQMFKVWRVKVLQEVKNSSGTHSNGDDDMEEGNSSGYEARTVLSPSWVEKKLQCPSLS